MTTQRFHLYRLITFIVLVSLISGCTSFTTAVPVQNRDYVRAKVSASPRNIGYYRVKRGDTLFSIAWGHRKDPKEVAKWNNLSSPYTIYPGQKLRLSPPAHARYRHKKTAPPKTISPKKPPKRAIKPTVITRATGPLHWQWPTQGKVVKSYKKGSKEHNGIDIGGKKNQPIYASEAGEIVYSGNKLVGYGNLIIIQHRKNFLSAYAHNQTLLVSVGKQINKGQKIALMGINASRPVLHFEIRQRGNPINPIWRLPKR